MDVRDKLLVKLVTFLCFVITAIIAFATKELSEIGDNLMKLNVKMAAIIERVEYHDVQIREIRRDIRDK